MKLAGKKSPIITTLYAILLFSSFVAYADPASPPGRRSLQAKPTTLTEPYQLNLSLSDYRSASPDFPYIALNIANRTQDHLLLFIWRSAQDAVYKVEYKAPTNDPFLNTGWKELKPDIKATSSPSRVKPSSDNDLNQSSCYAERFIIKSGQTGFGEAYPSDVPLSKQGFYRITAVVTVPEAREFDDSASQEPPLRVFTLVMHSKPLVIRRTATGFAEVPAAATKPASAH